MSTVSALIVSTVIVFASLAAIWQAINGWQADSERDHIVAAARDRLATRPGPISEWADVPWLQVLEDAEEYVDQLAVFDPELADGFDRLRAAAIPEQREEEDR